MPAAKTAANFASKSLSAAIYSVTFGSKNVVAAIGAAKLTIRLTASLPLFSSHFSKKGALGQHKPLCDGAQRFTCCLIVATDG